MYLFEVPWRTEKKSNLFVSIIDASGSMNSYWKAVAENFNKYVPGENAVTITFDNRIHHCADNKLGPEIRTHGGGMTNIPQAFEAMDEQLEKYPKTVAATVLFISDGQDNNLSTLEERMQKLKGHQGRSITFLCMGIQSQFPTFLSMYLRELYHNTQSTIPALYLIEYFSEAAVFNKFETMKEHFLMKKRIKVAPPTREFPWNSPVDDIYEGTMILTDESMLLVEGKEYNLGEKSVNLDAVMALFRSYVQELQMLSLQKSPSVKDYAQVALETMKIVIEYYKDLTGIDLYIDEEESKVLTYKFADRVVRNKLRHNQFRIKSYVENIAALTQGSGVKDLSEWEAAKKIGIGTITGTYHQKALKLKKFTVEMFTAIKNDFIRVYKDLKIGTESTQEASVITLQNQKEIFLESGLIEGLEGIENQFDLVEALPVVGLALKVKRYSGSQENPWLVEVKYIGTHHKALDSITLLHKDFKVELPTGEGKVEMVNAVLPLFAPEDKDLAPLLSHDLFHLLMTFVVNNNLDILYTDAYLSLLANTAVFLISQPPSEWKDDHLNRVIFTTHLVYSHHPQFREYHESFISHPQITLQYGSQDKSSLDLSNTLLHLLYMYFYKEVSNEKLHELMNYVYSFFFKKVTDQKKVHEFLRFEAKTLGMKVKEEIRKDFDKYLTIGEVERDLNTRVKQAFEKGICPVKVQVKKLMLMEDKVNLGVLSKFHDFFFQEALNEEDYLYYLYSAFKHPKQPIGEVTRDPQQIRVELYKDLHSQLIDGVCNKLWQGVREEFTKCFKENHMFILPISWQTLTNHAQTNKIDIHTFHYMPAQNLVKNACLSKGCPYYLKPLPCLLKHLSTWCEKLPDAFHKTVKLHYKEDPKAILDRVLEGQYMRNKPKTKQNLGQFDSNEEEALKYIQMLQLAYMEIALEEEKGFGMPITLRDKWVNAPKIQAKGETGRGGGKNKGRGGKGRGRGRGRGGKNK